MSRYTRNIRHYKVPKMKKQYQVTIRLGHKYIFSKYFKTLEKAILARDKFIAELKVDQK
jgi:hypothetical protein